MSLLLVAGYAHALDDGTSWWAHVATLADDNMEGRNAGSAGHRRAAEYIAAKFKAAGLKAGGSARFLQSVPLAVQQIVE